MLTKLPVLPTAANRFFTRHDALLESGGPRPELGRQEVSTGVRGVVKIVVRGSAGFGGCEDRRAGECRYRAHFGARRSSRLPGSAGCRTTIFTTGWFGQADPAMSLRIT